MAQDMLHYGWHLVSSDFKCPKSKKKYKNLALFPLKFIVFPLRMNWKD